MPLHDDASGLASLPFLVAGHFVTDAARALVTEPAAFHTSDADQAPTLHTLQHRFNVALLPSIVAAWLHALCCIRDDAKSRHRHLCGARVYAALPRLGARTDLAHTLALQLHTQAAQAPVWLLRSGLWGGLSDGYFVAPGASGIGPLALAFVQQHLPVFDVPWDVVSSLQHAGVQGIKEVRVCCAGGTRVSRRHPRRLLMC